MRIVYIFALLVCFALTGFSSDKHSEEEKLDSPVNRVIEDNEEEKTEEPLNPALLGNQDTEFATPFLERYAVRAVVFWSLASYFVEKFRFVSHAFSVGSYARKLCLGLSGYSLLLIILGNSIDEINPRYHLRNPMISL